MTGGSCQLDRLGRLKFQLRPMPLKHQRYNRRWGTLVGWILGAGVRGWMEFVKKMKKPLDQTF